MKYRIGDRLEWIYSDRPAQASLVEFISDKEFQILEGPGKGGTRLYSGGWNFKSPSEWKYLGNFSKSDSFEELYDLMNS